MGVLLEGFKIANAEITGAGFEIIAKRQRTERRVAARAAPVDHRSILVGLTARRQKLRAVHAIVDIDNSPIAIQSFAIFAAIARAAAVVNVEHRHAATGPILNCQHQDGDGG